MGIWYTTREDVKSALDMRETARNARQIDGAIDAATPIIEGCLHRRFYPLLATRYFPWPTAFARSWRIWFEEHDLISASSVVSSGTIITDYFLEPANSGPPYTNIQINRGGSASFVAATTDQRNVAITGLWGYRNDELTAGLTVEALDSSETGIDVDGPTAAAVGVGSILRIDSERMIVTGRSWLDTTQNLATPLTADKAGTTVAVATGSAFTVGELILLDSERMEIVDIAGNNLTVRRAVDGSVLAAHTGSDVYASRTLTVTRAALGTTAASHSSGATVLLFVVPGLVRELAVAHSLNILLGRQSGYARVVGSGEAQREATGRGLKDIESDAYTAHGRKARHLAV